MIKEIRTTKEVIVKKKYCDICESELKNSLSCSSVRCEMCKKDLCNNCIGKENDTMGDFREAYCKKCWEIGAPYRKEMEELENKIDELSENWLNECLK